MTTADWKLERVSYDEDAKDIYALLLKAFFFHEPATCRLFKKYGPLPPESSIAIQALKQGYSFKAVSKESGKICGVVINLNYETLTDWSPTSDKEPGQSLNKFFDYVDKVSGGEEEGWINLQILTVDPEWRRRGIAETLVQATEEEARAKGFRGVKTMATSAFTGKLVEKRGWTKTFELPYSDYPDSIFTSGPPHEAVTIYVLRNSDYTGSATSDKNGN